MLRLQSPGGERDLLQAVIEAADGANTGGGFFAFASAAGARLLLRDPVFQDLLGRGTFDLLVGLDAITDPEALAEIASVAEQLPGLRAQAFFHERSTLFHPKLCWFRKGRRLRVLVGSGNLTVGGLRTNWEAFLDSTFDGEGRREVEKVIEHWKETHAGLLLPLDAGRVVERARRNKRDRALLGGRSAGRTEALAEAFGDPGGEPSIEILDVLVAEIPKSKGRWKQANFNKDSYETFFGVQAGEHRRIVLRHVGATGSLGPIESRPGVAVKSHNYRFELAAASGIAYPRISRPIGVFLKTQLGIFLYRLLLPGDASYQRVTAFLDSARPATLTTVRRVRTSADELRAYWPDAPLWLVVPDDLESA